MFSERITDWPVFMSVLMIFIAFCAASSFVYVLNDLADRGKDKLHPGRSGRAIISGVIGPKEAKLAAGILLAVALAVSLVQGRSMLYVAGYIVLNLAYLYYFREIFILDVILISSGFVIRATAGAAGVGIRISPWLIVCSFLLSLLVSLGKRYNELEILKDSAPAFRRPLAYYSKELLEGFIQTVSAVTIMAYSMYTFFAPNLPKNDAMMLTIPFVIYGVFRYNYILKVGKLAGSPEEIILKDRPMLANLLGWLGSAAAVLYLF